MRGSREVCREIRITPQPRENLNLLDSPSKVDGNKHLISPAKLALEPP